MGKSDIRTGAINFLISEKTSSEQQGQIRDLVRSRKETMKPRIVIIGGGFGGLSAAQKLKHADANVTLIDRSNYHLFQPLLYQVATAGLSPANIAAPIRSILRKQENIEVLMEEVTGIDTAHQRVIMGSRDLHYDYLVVATGSLYTYFGHDDWKNFAPGLKSITDATSIRRKILLAFEAAEMESDPEVKKAKLTFIVVGGGPTGVEMAGSIAELAHYALKSDFRHIDPQMTRIYLIEAGPRILAAFPENLANKATQKLRSLGVEVIANCRVERVNEQGVTYLGKEIHSRTVIWCAGVIASPAGRWLKADTDRVGRVKVNPDLTLPGHPEVYVIGDTALVMQDGKPLPGIAPVAMQEGRYVGSAISVRLTDSSSSKPFIYKDKGNLATVGRSFAIADLGKLRLSGMFAWLVWVVVHIYYLIGFKNRLMVMTELAWAYFTFQRGARIITDVRERE